MPSDDPPDDVCSCLPFLCEELGVMHHLLQETNDPHLQLHVQLKVLRSDGRVIAGGRSPKKQRGAEEMTERHIPVGVWTPSDAAHLRLCW